MESNKNSTDYSALKQLGPGLITGAADDDLKWTLNLRQQFKLH